MSWGVDLSPRAEKQIGKFDPRIRLQVLEDLKSLSKEPFPKPPRGKKLKGFGTPTYRLKSGDYRAVYRPVDETMVILAVFDRKDLEKELHSLR